MALLKDTQINERFNLQFRAEFFNVFNHAQFASINGNFSAGTGTGTASQLSGRRPQRARSAHRATMLSSCCSRKTQKRRGNGRASARPCFCRAKVSLLSEKYLYGVVFIHPRNLYGNLMYRFAMERDCYSG